MWQVYCEFHTGQPASPETQTIEHMTMNTHHPSAEWSARFTCLLDDATGRLGVSRQRLAQALGFGTNLSQSTLSAPAAKSRMLTCLDAANVPLTASQLRLDARRYEALEDFFREALLITLGVEANYRTARGAHREMADWAHVGAELTDTALFDDALVYLTTAWNVLCELPSATLESTSILLHAALRTGTQIMAIDAHHGQTPRTQRIISKLQPFARTIAQSSSSSRDLRHAVGLFYKGAGVAYRLFGNLPASTSVSYSKQAYALLHATGPGDSAAAALRDQAKPLLREILANSGRSGDAGSVFSLLDRALAMVGGNCPQEQDRVEWLFTTLAVVDCLLCVGRVGDADRTLQDVCARKWLAAVQGVANSSIATKLTVSQMMMETAKGHLDGVGVEAAAFLADPRFAQFADRRCRVSSLQAIATGGDLSKLPNVLLR